jgi:hypothetical protein
MLNGESRTNPVTGKSCKATVLVNVSEIMSQKLIQPLGILLMERHILCVVRSGIW